MKIVVAKLYQYDLPLAWPLPLKTTRLERRQGLILELKVNDSGFGVGYLYGESAPLPDFSSETLEEACQQLSGLASALVGQQVEPESFNSQAFNRQAFNSHALNSHALNSHALNSHALNSHALNSHALNSQEWCDQAVYPSVAFALESAIAWPLIQSADSGTGLPVAPLLTGSTTEMLQRIENWSSCWPAVFKLKVGRSELKSDVDRIRQLLAALPETVSLKLDANCRWSLDQAIEFADQVDSARIAYIEEPVTHASGQFMADQQVFYQKTKMPYAWDETLQNPDFEFTPQTGLAAIVVKPTLVGGIRRCESLVNAAREAGIKRVISSSFESVLGVNTLAALARAWAPREAAGLDTLNAFKQHLFDDPVPLWQRLPDRVLQQMELVWH